jgi:hypothetical protein
MVISDDVENEPGKLCQYAHLFHVKNVGDRCAPLYMTEVGVTPAERGLCDWSKCPIRGASGRFLKTADSFLIHSFPPNAVTKVKNP